MATRAIPLSPDHVRALNRIDVEFVVQKHKEVTAARNALLNHFGECPNPPSLPTADAAENERERYEHDNRAFENALARWIERTDEFRTGLLKEMGVVLGYDFDEVNIRKATYGAKLQGIWK